MSRARKAVPPCVAGGLWALALVGIGFGLHRLLRSRTLSPYERGYVDGLAHEPMASQHRLMRDTDPE